MTNGGTSPHPIMLVADMGEIITKTDAEPLLAELPPKLTLGEVLHRMRERGLDDESDWLVQHITQIILANQS